MVVFAWEGSESPLGPPKLAILSSPRRHEAEKTSYRPRHAARGVATNRTSRDGSASAARAHRARHAASEQPFEPAHIEHTHDYRRIVQAAKAVKDDSRRRQIAGLTALLALSSPIAITGPIPLLSPAPRTQPRALVLLKDPAVRGALALMFSAVALAVWALCSGP